METIEYNIQTIRINLKKLISESSEMLLQSMCTCLF